MNLETFAAERSTTLTEMADLLRPEVREALRVANDEERTEQLLNAALSAYEVTLADLTGNDEPFGVASFASDINEAITLITPDGTDAQVDRVTNWMATAALGAATLVAGGPNSTKTWVTMLDPDVRDTHQELHATTIDSTDFFTVATEPPAQMMYPGQPVGPIEAWINCRCVLAIDAPSIDVQANLDVDGADQSETAPSLELVAAADDPDDPPPPDELLDGRTDEVLEWHAVIAPVNTRSGDGRTFTELTHRDLPLPLEWQEKTAPEHDGSVLVGTQRQMAQVGNEWRAAGTWLDTDDADRVIGHIAEGALRSVSVQLDDAEAAISEDEEGVEYSGRICATTIVNVGAFPECWIKLGPAPAGFFGEEESMAAGGQNSTDNGTVLAREYDTDKRKDMADRGTAMPDGSFPIADEEDLRNAIQAIGRAKDPDAAKRHIRKRARALGKEDLIPDTWAASVQTFRRGSGWVTHPEATRRIHTYWTRGKGAAKIRWGVPGDFNRCRRQLAKYVSPRFLNRTCAQWHHDAIGIWPGQETGKRRKSALDGPPASLLARGSREPISSEYFTELDLPGPTPLTVHGKELFGHLAVFGTCHVGFPDTCTEPPTSPTNYAYFHTGVVDTDRGELPVGVITMNTGHAQRHDGSADAAAHYDHTGTQVARVRAGEDQYGIWVHGIMNDLTDDQLDRFKAATLSGDWRKIGGKLELVAALAVNVPGFPIPRTAMAASAGEVISLVAAGIVSPMMEATIADLTDAVVAEIDRRHARQARLAAMESTAQYARQRRAAALLAAVES